MEDFDSDKYLFNCANGAIDLRTMEFRERSPADRLTKIAPVDYLPNARSERLDRFIRESEMPALSGMVFCADCGAKMYHGTDAGNHP